LRVETDILSPGRGWKGEKGKRKEGKWGTVNKAPYRLSQKKELESILCKAGKT